MKRLVAILAALFALSPALAHASTVAITKHCYRSASGYQCPSATVTFSGWGDGLHGATVWTQASAACNGGVAHAVSWSGDALEVTYWASGRGSSQNIGGVCVR